MFKNLFSFNGRISRKEYIISLTLSFALLILFFAYGKDYEFSNLFLNFIMINYFWLNLSQGAKRCHDINENGVMQIVPFYIIVLLFTEGNQRNNDYGAPPSEKTNYNFIANFNLIETLQFLFPFIILNTFLIAILFKFISSDTLFNTLVYISIVLSYFLFLFFTSKDTNKTINTLWTQIIYALILYVITRVYFAYVFKFYFDFTMLPIEIFLAIIPLVLIQLATYFFTLLNKKNVEKI